LLRTLVRETREDPRAGKNLDRVGNHVKRPPRFTGDLDVRARDLQVAVEHAGDANGLAGDPASPGHARVRSERYVAARDRDVAADRRVDRNLGARHPDVVIGGRAEREAPAGRENVTGDALFDVDSSSGDDDVGAHRRGDLDVAAGRVVVVGLRRG
jgi:hypothetical protein